LIVSITGFIIVVIVVVVVIIIIIIIIIKSRRIKYAGHVPHMREMRNAY
jgi:hypothetical protein